MFFQRLDQLLREKQITRKKFSEDIEISKNQVKRWESGTIPNKSTINVIANYFGVTVEYLLGKTESLNEQKPTIEKNAIILDEKKIHMIPLFETVSAGFGAFADDYIVDYMPLYIANVTEAEETICVKVQGDSMYPKIEEGDVIQVHKQESVDSGSIAVVLLDDEDAFVKKVVYSDDWIELHSINPMYKTMRFAGEDMLRIRVLGLVRKIIKEV